MLQELKTIVNTDAKGKVIRSKQTEETKKFLAQNPNEKLVVTYRVIAKDPVQEMIAIYKNRVIMLFQKSLHEIGVRATADSVDEMLRSQSPYMHHYTKEFDLVLTPYHRVTKKNWIAFLSECEQTLTEHFNYQGENFLPETKPNAKKES